MVHGLSLATITGRWLGVTSFVQVSMTWALTCLETVHQRPCVTREIKSRLSDSRVSNNNVVDHISCWRPVLSPLHNCVDRLGIMKVTVTAAYWIVDTLLSCSFSDYGLLTMTVYGWVSEQFLNGISAHYRLFSAIKLEVIKSGEIYKQE